MFSTRILRSWLKSWLRPAPKGKARPSLSLERLEDRDLMAGVGPYYFDFGTSTSPVKTGYTRANLNEYTDLRGYGWTDNAGITAIDRGTTDALTRDGHLR